MNNVVLRCGAAHHDITPEIPIELCGYLIRQQPAVGVHDPLYIHALCLDDGITQLIWLNIDSLGFDNAFADQLRAAAAVACGLTSEHIILTATHTHSAPAAVHLAECGIAEPSYIALLLTAVPAVTMAAQNALEPAAARYATTTIADVAADRTNFGSYDDRAGIIVFERADGTTIAVLANFAMHNVALLDLGLVSADTAGVVVKLLRKQLSGSPEILMTNGCAGNLNPCHRGNFKEGPLKGGTLIAKALMTALEKAEPLKSTRLTIRNQRLDLPLQRWSLEKIKKTYAQRMADAANCDEYIRMYNNWYRHTLMLAQHDLLPKTTTGILQYVGIGKVEFALINAEVCVDMILELRATTSNRELFIVSYANGNIGYLAPGRFFGSGAYETDHAFYAYGNCPLDPNVFDLVKTNVLQLIKPESIT